MDDVDRLLDSGDLQGLVGRVEGPQLEAKGLPYDLSSARSRFELAKDVSAFANLEGGHLIIGAVTERTPDAQEDVIVRIEPIDPDKVNANAYVGVIEQYVFPRPEGLTGVVIRSADDAAAVGVIRVPRQDTDRGPFLVLHTLDGDDALSQAFVGFFQRLGDANEPMDARRLHRCFRDGMSTMAARLTRMEARLDGIAEGMALEAPEAKLQAELEDARIERMLKEGE